MMKMCEVGKNRNNKSKLKKRSEVKKYERSLKKEAKLEESISP